MVVGVFRKLQAVKEHKVIEKLSEVFSMWIEIRGC